jgi:hypothetical protein
MARGEEHPRLRPQPEIGDETGGVEDVVGGTAPVPAEHDVHLANLFAPSKTPQILTHPFVRFPMGEVAAKKVGARADDHIDVAPLDPGDAKYLRDRRLGKAARAFDPVQPLFGYGSEHLVVVEQCRRGIVGINMRTDASDSPSHDRGIGPFRATTSLPEVLTAALSGFSID